MKHKVNKHWLYRSNGLVKLILPCLFLLSLASCTQRRVTEKGFYYWRTILSANPKEVETLQQLQVKKLYVKFYDVVWDKERNRPDPVAKVQFTPNALARLNEDSIEIVPTIFITNEVLQTINENTTDELGERINNLLTGMLNNVNLLDKVKEVQFDCDWTEQTRDKYFSLLSYLKTLPFFMKAQVSATIRLYQCKYREKTGVPPVNRGVLLCYNMGNLKSSGTGNSILDANELQQYTGQLKEYPLPLDVALPIFEWKVLFRNDQFYALITNLPDSILNDNNVARTDKNYRELLMDTVLYGYPLKKGDRIRTEKSDYTEIMKAANVLSPLMNNPNFTVTLFHLDSTLLTKYSRAELDSIYRSFDNK